MDTRKGHRGYKNNKSWAGRGPAWPGDFSSLCVGYENNFEHGGHRRDAGPGGHRGVRAPGFVLGELGNWP